MNPKPCHWNMMAQNNNGKKKEKKKITFAVQNNIDFEKTAFSY